MKFTDKIRFYGINAPELKIRDNNKKLISNPQGLATLEVVNSLIKVGDIIIIETIKDNKEKYGRYLANIYVNKKDQQVFVNQYLLDNKLAVPMKY
jgi:micrococcal nuclease